MDKQKKRGRQQPPTTLRVPAADEIFTSAPKQATARRHDITSLHQTTVSLAPIRHRHRDRHRHRPDPARLYCMSEQLAQRPQRGTVLPGTWRSTAWLSGTADTRRLHDWEAESRREPGAVRSKVQRKREAGRARGESARRLNQKVESSLDYLRTWEHGGSYMIFILFFIYFFFTSMLCTRGSNKGSAAAILRSPRLLERRPVLRGIIRRWPAPSPHRCVRG